jgi:uncharacterized tellurite resistance protein B-like protein
MMTHLSHGDGLNEIARHVTLLFVAVSAADLKILKEEVFVMEKCAVDYGIGKEEWLRALSESLICYINEGDKAISEAIFSLSKILNLEQKRELIEDLLAIALADDILHEKEKFILKVVCQGFDVQIDIPSEFNFNCLET